MSLFLTLDKNKNGPSAVVHPQVCVCVLRWNSDLSSVFSCLWPGDFLERLHSSPPPSSAQTFSQKTVVGVTIKTLAWLQPGCLADPLAHRLCVLWLLTCFIRFGL